jgi:hypothetical protein
MLAIYRNTQPHILHIWYNHADAADFHGMYIGHKFSKNMTKKSNLWLSILVDGSYNNIISDALEIYIHGKAKSCIDLYGFDSLRVIYIVEKYRYTLVNIRQPTITLITSNIPQNITKEAKAITHKFVNHDNILKHHVKFRTVNLIEPFQSGEKITLR